MILFREDLIACFENKLDKYRKGDTYDSLESDFEVNSFIQIAEVGGASYGELRKTWLKRAGLHKKAVRNELLTLIRAEYRAMNSLDN